MKHDAELISRISPKDGRPSLENITVYTIDLSEYLDFDFYDIVWYWDTISGEKGQGFAWNMAQDFTQSWRRHVLLVIQ